jgi:gliding motility-associated lipoprotein GldH
MIDIPEKGWSEGDSLVYSFDVKDNNFKYDTYLKLRYTSEYKFYNFYIQYALYDSTGKQILKKLDQALLFDSKTGEYRGSEIGGLADIESKLYYLKEFSYPYPGKYSLVAKQYMRLNPLLGIKSIGFKIEKIQKP